MGNRKADLDQHFVSHNTEKPFLCRKSMLSIRKLHNVNTEKKIKAYIQCSVLRGLGYAAAAIVELVTLDGLGHDFSRVTRDGLRAEQWRR